MMKRSRWLSGLLYGEELAEAGFTPSDIEQHVDEHTFGPLDDFDNGVLDYVKHASRTE